MKHIWRDGIIGVIVGDALFTEYRRKALCFSYGDIRRYS